MKFWRWGWVGLLIAVSACSLDQLPQEQSTANRPSESTADLDQASCAAIDTQVPLRPGTDVELPFERFDFRPTQVETTDTTLTFRGDYYAFTFCKRDRSWGIQALEPAPAVEEDYAEYFQGLSDPDYATITSQAQTYQARVRLDAPWLENQPASENDPEQVIFELLKPGDSQPVSKVLYTNTDIIERELGASAGIPTVTQSLATDDALWWAIGFEQGEGASGITTVVQYKVDSDEIILWQPEELGNVQITDLALTGVGAEATLWLGTQYSGEGNPYLPAKGLVAYNPTENTLQTYTPENSPLLGVIPSRLWTETESLWVATANGVCEVDWATVDANDSWSCWRFTAMADAPANQAIYPSLLAETSIDTLENTRPVELLWLAKTDISTPEAPTRYEISYAPGITTQLNQGATYYIGPKERPDDGYFWWPGQEWSWNGERFVRYLDQVAVNYVGGGPQGIGPTDYENYVADWQTMRGEFELLNLTAETTDIKYYSAWIDEAAIEPWVTIAEVTNASLKTTNPTDAVLARLKQTAQ